MKIQSLKGQRILITGASMGIGRELALECARSGAEILYLIARSEEKLHQVAKEVRSFGAEATALACDITQNEQQENLIRTILADTKPLDIIIHNAGKGMYSYAAHAPLSEVRSLFELNFFAPLVLFQKLMPALQKPGGRLVFISSIAGHIAVPKMSAYCASKSALNAMVESLRVECKSQGIHVLNVYPGLTQTDFSKHAPTIDPRPEAFSTLSRGLPADVVARKIVRAISLKKRDEWITFSNRFFAGMHTHFPKIFDWAMKRFVR